MNLSEPTTWSVTGPGAYAARLPRGEEFHFRIDREDLPFTNLCEVAIRNNPRRRFLFVSRVLGRHWPVRPAALRDVAARLAKKVSQLDLGDPTIFIGMAETATSLGQAVFREWRNMGRSGLYIESTRRRTGGAIAFQFSEIHSHASLHLIHQPGAKEDPGKWFAHARHVVIVDDEATTKATASALIRALREWRPNVPFSSCLAAILTWKVQPTAPPHDLDSIVALVEGSFEFCSAADFPSPPRPRDAVGSSVPTRREPRHGVRDPEALPSDWDVSVAPGERILVVGNGEHGYRPLLLAEALEFGGALSWLQATTRSPILPGGGIGHVREFPALSGEDHREFLYNVPDDHPYTRVILCTEDSVPSRNHPIWQIPHLEVRS